jgi:hypothetical protein
MMRRNEQSRHRWQMVLCIATVALSSGLAARANAQAALPPAINVSENGQIRRDAFPVTGSVPLPKGESPTTGTPAAERPR